jgi:hypothetical protein
LLRCPFENLKKLFVKQGLTPIKDFKLPQCWKNGADPLSKGREGHLERGLFIQPLTFRTKLASKVAAAIDINIDIRERE